MGRKLIRQGMSIFFQLAMKTPRGLVSAVEFKTKDGKGGVQHGAPGT
jgi:hypothetical protein